MKTVFAFLPVAVCLVCLSIQGVAQTDADAAARKYLNILQSLSKGTPQAADDAVKACDPKTHGYLRCAAVRGIAHGIKKDIPNAVAVLQVTNLDNERNKERAYSVPADAVLFQLIQTHVNPYYNYLEGNWSWDDSKVAVAKYRSAIASSPKLYKAWASLSREQVAEKNYAAALESINNAIAQVPDLKQYPYGRHDIEYLFRRADVYMDLGDVASKAKALIDVKRAMANGGAYKEGGAVYLVELDSPGEIVGAGDMDEHCSKRKDVDVAIVCYNNAIKHVPEDHIILQMQKPVLYYRRAKLFYEKKQWAEAAADYEVYFKFLSGSLRNGEEIKPRLLNEFAGSFINANKYQQAVDLASRSITIDPNDLMAYYIRGKGYWGLKKLDAALADYTKAIQLKPQQILWNDRAHLLMEMGDNKGAIPDLLEVLKLDPNNEDAKKHLKELGATP